MSKGQSPVETDDLPSLPARDRLEAARLILGASVRSVPEAQAIFLAKARLLFEAVREDLVSFEILLIAREREFAARAAPKEQLPIAEGKR